MVAADPGRARPPPGPDPPLARWRPAGAAWAREPRARDIVPRRGRSSPRRWGGPGRRRNHPGRGSRETAPRSARTPSVSPRRAIWPAASRAPSPSVSAVGRAGGVGCGCAVGRARRRSAGSSAEATTRADGLTRAEPADDLVAPGRAAPAAALPRGVAFGPEADFARAPVWPGATDPGGTGGGPETSSGVGGAELAGRRPLRRCGRVRGRLPITLSSSSGVLIGWGD